MWEVGALFSVLREYLKITHFKKVLWDFFFDNVYELHIKIALTKFIWPKKFLFFSSYHGEGIL